MGLALIENDVILAEMTTSTTRSAKSRPSPVGSGKKLPCGRPALPAKEQTPSAAGLLLERLVIRLNAYCVEKKLNRSETREKILETIISGAQHFTALDLLERLQKQFPEIGKATLYRNLPVLVESGILQEGPHDSKGQVLYELSDDSHCDHIVCLDCRRIFEFHDDRLEKRQDKISGDLRFTPRSHRHVIFAACDYLRKNPSRR